MIRNKCLTCGSIIDEEHIGAKARHMKRHLAKNETCEIVEISIKH